MYHTTHLPVVMAGCFLPIKIIITILGNTYTSSKSSNVIVGVNTSKRPIICKQNMHGVQITDYKFISYQVNVLKIKTYCFLFNS